MLKATVLVHGAPSPEGLREIEEAFRSVGVEAVAGAAPHRGVAEVALAIVATLPIGAFLDGFVEDAGGDLYRRIKDFVLRVVGRARSPDRRMLVLQDERTKVQVVLEPDLPHEGYDQLFRLDLSRYRFGPLHYDRDREQWRSELDEWETGGPAGW